MRRVVIALATAALAIGLACGVALAAGAPSGWSWLVGDLGTASIGQLNGGDDEFVGAYYGGPISAELSGKTILDTDVRDGYYEFEHSAASPNTVFLPETETGTSAPMTAGRDDGQDVTPLIVSGQSGMTDDLQTWQLGTTQLSGIDSQGRLRINGIVLQPISRNGKIELEAVLPDGSTQLLVPARS